MKETIKEKNEIIKEMKFSLDSQTKEIAILKYKQESKPPYSDYLKSKLEESETLINKLKKEKVSALLG